MTFDFGFGIANLAGIDWSSVALDTPFAVISTTQIFDEDDIENFGFANRISVGSGREAYFTSGSLNVVVVPEPGTLALLAGGALAGLVELRRRRKSLC